MGHDATPAQPAVPPVVSARRRGRAFRAGTQVAFAVHGVELGSYGRPLRESFRDVHAVPAASALPARVLPKPVASCRRGAVADLQRRRSLRSAMVARPDDWSEGISRLRVLAVL